MANNIKMYRKTKAQIDNTPITDGLVMFDTENKDIYLDNGNIRKSYGRNKFIPNSTEEVTEVLNDIQCEDDVYKIKTYDIKNQNGVILPQRRSVLINGGYAYDDESNGITNIDIVKELTMSQFDELSDEESEEFQWTTDEDDIILTTNDVNYGDGYLTEKILELNGITFETLSDVNIDSTILLNGQILSYINNKWVNVDEITVDTQITSTSENTFENKAFCDFMNNILPEATETDNPISISNASGLNAKSLKVELEPIQDLNGYDSPWVGGGGKNKFNKDALSDTNTVSVTQTANGFVLTAKRNDSSYLSTIGNIYGNYAGQTIYAKATLTASGSNVPYLVISFRDTNGTEINSTKRINLSVNTSSGSIVAPTGTVEIRLVLYCSFQKTCDIGDTATFTNVSVSLENMSEWSPYSNICPISGRTQTVVSRTGLNIWDEQWENGIYKITDGTKNNATSALRRIRTKNPIPILPNTEYYKTSPTTGFRYLLFYDENMNYLSYNNPAENASFTTPNKAYYMNTYTESDDYGTVYKNDICINVSNASVNGTYESYKGKANTTIPFNQTVYGGEVDVTSGGTKEIVGFKEYVGAEDEDWHIEGLLTGYNFYINVPDAKPAQAKNTSKHIICNVAEISSFVGSQSNKAFISNAKNFNVTIGDIINCNTVAKFKTWLSTNHIQVIYELATPTTISTPSNEISLLKGNNTLSTSGDNMDLKYSATIS